MKWTTFAVLLACRGILPAQTADQRARDVVSRMTLDEKIQEIHGMTRTPTQARLVSGIPRLGIPPLRITNGPAGIGNGGPGHEGKATALPAPIALAATWDLEMALLYGKILGVEGRDLANDLVEAPDINIARTPQCGRTFEAFGEDPYLVGRISAGEITGIQRSQIIANVKHFAANNQEEGRHNMNEVIGERALREIYLPAFEASVKEGRSASVMCSYPAINGAFSCENEFLLAQVLRKEWGFTGFVTPDYLAVHNMVPAVLAGLDVDALRGEEGLFTPQSIKAALASGKLTIAMIDDMLIRRFRTMMESGVWDHPATLQPVPEKEDGTDARRIAEQGMVLLKNQGGILPLNAGGLHSIALIGPYAGKASTGGGGSSSVKAAYTVAPLDGLQARAGSKIAIQLVDGSDLAKAAEAAKSADVAIVMVGDHASEGHDQDIKLSGNQDQLVETVAEANPRTIVVVKAGSAVAMPWLAKAPAVVDAWYPGEDDGNAVAAVLFGDVNPSGKLPVTFPKRLADSPITTPEQYPGDAKVDGYDRVAHYTEGIFVGYRWYDTKSISPLFPFGYGLSYTTFSFGKFTASSAGVDFDVTNTGKRAGAEVAQVYIGKPGSAAVPEPTKELVGFQKVQLQPGETRHVHVGLSERSFSHWDVDTHSWKVTPGAYRILVGASSRDIQLQGQVKK
ncbi:MAG TPA: glycoside hydrolase family 3 C-terminal domain-containing protein [Verrucomicrobiae bacterium]|nr:glycoside hydrolase family 3 C-terminal domain-containing protein [Verrucomicrobiae bacterium]